MDTIQDDENFCDKTIETSPSKHKRKRRTLIKGADDEGCKTITLYWKLAERWNKERGILSDTLFVEYLLLLRQKYMKLKSRCKCEASSDVESCDPGRANINIEMDEEELSLGGDDSWSVNGRRQIVKIEVEDDDFIEFDFDDEFTNRQNSGRIGRKSDGILGPYRRVCGICKTAVERGTPKNVHILSEHSTVFVKCRLCKNSQDDERTENLVSLSDFYDHLNCVHHALEITCPFCRPGHSKQGENTSVMDSSTLSRHILEKHSQSLMCRCNICHGEANKNPKAEKLMKAVSLKSHIALKHTVQKQKRVPCEQCGLLVTLSSLSKHIKNVHTEKIQDENNLCDLCGKYFVHLKQHKLSVHKKESWSFKCKICSKSFAKRYNLEVHSRTHTGEKPFICDVCGKGFCQNVELKIHTKTNHGNSKRKQRNGTKKKTLTIPVDGAVFVQKDTNTPVTTNTNRLLLPALANIASTASPSEYPSSIQTDALQSQPRGNEPSIATRTVPEDYVYAVIAYPGQVNDILTGVTAAESRTVVPVISITNKDQSEQLPKDTAAPLCNATWVNQTESKNVTVD